MYRFAIYFYSVSRFGNICNLLLDYLSKRDLNVLRLSVLILHKL